TCGVVRAFHQAESPGASANSSGSEAAADLDGRLSPVPVQEDSKAMAGSLGADTGRATLQVAARVSASPSCSWLSPLPANHERHPQCSISTVLSSTGEGASSS